VITVWGMWKVKSEKWKVKKGVTKKSKDFFLI
jgi:hypothetical protein